MPFTHWILGGLRVEAWTVFGRLPVALLLLALLVAGLRRGWDWRGALTATAALGAGLSLGSALLPSVIGAVGGGIAAWLVAQRVLGLRRPPLAALAIGLTLVVAIGRVGCLLAGCCFGHPTALPWAVHYGHASAPWQLHRALGLIGDLTPSSLGVHPYPLYECLALLLWVPVALWLARRKLRSEGALLALTAAYDLAVRAYIDGTRAMLNVWWSKLSVPRALEVAGLDRLQWALAIGAFSALFLAVLLERRARVAATRVTQHLESQARVAPHLVRVAPRVEAPRALAVWGVFLCAWLVGLVFDAAQTPFLYRLHLLTLIAAVPALQLPALQLPALRLPAPRLPAPRLPALQLPALRLPALRLAVLRFVLPLAGPLLALGLVALLAPRAEMRRARADEPMANEADANEAGANEAGIENSIDERGWIYEVDHRHGTLVRIGSMTEPVAALRVRHLALQLEPATPATPATYLDYQDYEDHRDHERVGGGALADPRGPRVTHHWLGLEFAGGTTSYIRESGCGGGVSIFDRQGLGGWLRYDAHVPLAESWTMSVGVRAGGGVATTERIEGSGAMETQEKRLDRLGFASAWIEFEDPHFAFGLVLYGDYYSATMRADGVESLNQRYRVRVGGHLRLGFSALAFDLGYLDRDALLGLTTLRVGAVGMVDGSGDPVTRMEDVRIRYGAGMLTYPSTADPLSAPFGAYIFGEYLPIRGFAIQLQAALFPNGGMAGLSLRLGVGD